MLDITYAIQFYIIFSICGFLGFYVLSKVLKNTNKIILYSISKPLGLILLAYPIWLLSSAKLLKFNQNTTLLIIFLLITFVAIGGIIYEYQKKYAKKDIESKSARNFLIGIGLIEVSMILLYSIYLFIRSFNPQIEGTEKFMDLMLLSSAGKTEYFPFADAWWAGKDVNYYYYGFYIFSLIANIGSIPYAYAYNLSLGLIFAQTIVTSFIIVFKVTKNYISAFFGAALVNLSGNLHYANCVAQNFNEKLDTACYYPKASRILDPAFTINEFPTYSYILGDLHPHVLSLTFLMLGFYFLVEIFKEKKFNVFLHLLFGFVIATAGLINFWDFMTLGALYGIIFLYKIGKDLWKNRSNFKKYFNKNGLIFTLRIVLSFLLAASPFILYFPFFLHFQSPVAGLGFIPEFVAYHSGKHPDMQWPSSSWFQFGMWGVFLVLIIPAFITTFLLDKENRKKLIFPIILFSFGIVLIIFTELFYFKDLFHIANAPYFRANTVFKFTYHSWIIFGLATAISLGILWKALGKIKDVKWGLSIDILTMLLISVVFTIAFCYPYFGFKQAYGLNEFKFKQLEEKDFTLTLDGSKFIEKRDIDDYNTINWINKNQKERVVVLEAVGGAYTYFARIGVFTGMGNVINWETHEWTWRFHYPEDIKDWKEVTEKNLGTGYSEISLVTNDVKTIYNTSDLELARGLLSNYKVKYVYIGNQERTTYTEMNEEKFNELGEIVYQSGQSKLYRIKS